MTQENPYPGFTFTFCFDGEDAAKEQASESGNVIFWKSDKRMIAVPACDGVAVFDFESKDECSIAMRTIWAFNTFSQEEWHEKILPHNP